MLFRVLKDLGNGEQLIMEMLIYVLLFFLFNKTANTAERS